MDVRMVALALGLAWAFVVRAVPVSSVQPTLLAKVRVRVEQQQPAPAPAPAPSTPWTINKDLAQLQAAAATATEEQRRRMVEAATAAQEAVRFTVQQATDESAQEHYAVLEGIDAAQEEEMVANQQQQAQDREGMRDGAMNAGANVAKQAATAAIDEVSRQTEAEASYLVESATRMEAEANALAVKVATAADVSKVAAQQSEEWMHSLPAAEAANATKLGNAADRIAKMLSSEAKSARLLAKMSANMALTTHGVAKEAEEHAIHAQTAARQAVQQAMSNFQLLKTIKAKLDDTKNIMTNAI